MGASIGRFVPHAGQGASPGNACAWDPCRAPGAAPGALSLASARDASHERDRMADADHRGSPQRRGGPASPFGVERASLDAVALRLELCQHLDPLAPRTRPGGPGKSALGQAGPRTEAPEAAGPVTGARAQNLPRTDVREGSDRSLNAVLAVSEAGFACLPRSPASPALRRSRGPFRVPSTGRTLPRTICGCDVGWLSLRRVASACAPGRASGNLGARHPPPLSL